MAKEHDTFHHEISSHGLSMDQIQVVVKDLSFSTGGEEGSSKLSFFMHAGDAVHNTTGVMGAGHSMGGSDFAHAGNATQQPLELPFAVPDPSQGFFIQVHPGAITASLELWVTIGDLITYRVGLKLQLGCPQVRMRRPRV